MDDLKILDVIEEAKAQQRELMPTGVLDDKAARFAAHNRSGVPCHCMDCRAVRAHFSRDVD
jgi:hypothetical protein